jgi:UDP-GlcNAc3NAcA epimerase
MPEEINRIVTDRLSNLLFCPTKASYENLINEGYNILDEKYIYITGDVMNDAVKIYSDNEIPMSFELPKDYVLATMHRQENLSDCKKTFSIFSALNEISLTKEVIMPLHPHTRKILEKQEVNINNIRIIEPVGYIQMLSLIKNSSIVLTDSGGLQKEAFMLDKFCLTLREETEWIELVELGYNILVGSDTKKILENYELFINKEFNNKPNLYGDGKASSIIVKHLIDYLC